MLRLSGRPSITVHYEDFCEDPARICGAINRWLDLDIPTNDVVRHIDAHTYHDIGGDPLRFEPIERIRLDDAWREDLGPAARAVGRAVVLLTSPLWRPSTQATAAKTTVSAA